MKRILLSAVIVLGAGAFLVFATGATNKGSAAGTYKIELDNGFGLVTGADFKVAGVQAGKIEKIDLPKGCVNGDTTQCFAQVTVKVTQSGFGSFRTDAFCQSRPQSLIGEYFIECQPGHSGKVIQPGGVIPVKNTESTIPGDLLQNVMRMPYRQRFTLIINELGAAVAGRSDDLAAALRRAVPALTETDNLLNLLANDSHTLQQLTTNSNQVITALANNKAQVARFIDEANRTAVATAKQQNNLQLTFQKLPGFLEQLKPSMAKLGATADANIPVLRNLNEASGQLNRLFTNLPGFAHSSMPALRSLGQASVTGKQAVKAATPTVHDLNKFAKPTPELAQNLAIVLHDLDSRSRAVEADSRSPGGKGYTGLEALLQYVFNQTLAINAFGQFGHMLAVDAFVDPRCSQYATLQSVANGLQQYGAKYRECYAWLGPNQPGVNETDPSDPSACVPDPGGAPPGETGPRTSACKLGASPNPLARSASTRGTGSRARTAAATSDAPAASRGRSSGAGSSGGGSSGGKPTLQSTLAGILSGMGGSQSSSSSAPSSTSTTTSSSGSPGNQAQQLLSYLLAP
jgi:phospholipid/cholesterol/gamma-HCH transport system substrate-binding protein